MKSFDTVNGENFQSSYGNNVKKWFALNLLALFHFLELMHGLNFDLQRQKRTGINNKHNCSVDTAIPHDLHVAMDDIASLISHILDDFKK